MTTEYITEDRPITWNVVSHTVTVPISDEMWEYAQSINFKTEWHFSISKKA